MLVVSGANSVRTITLETRAVRASRKSSFEVTAKRRGEDDEEDNSLLPGGFRNPFQKVIKTVTSRSAPVPAGKGTKRIRKEPKKAPEKAPSAGTQRLTFPFKLPGFGGVKSIGPRDANTFFVAGGSGRLGARIVREILLSNPKAKVRAGVRDLERAEGVLAVATAVGILPAEAVKRLSIHAVDLEEPQSITQAIGNAKTVVQAIGAPESEAFNFSNYKKIDGDGAIAIVEAATEAKVDHYVMVTSLGTSKLGFPAAALNLFGGVLTQKRRGEVALEESGMRFTIVRPGGMERPTDTYKLTHNVRLDTKDKLFGGQVSRQQVAELVAAAVANPDLAENKILEVVAEEQAPLVEYTQLLEAAPAEFTQEARLAEQAAEAERQAALEEAQDQAEALLAEVEAASEAAEAAYADARAAQQEAQAARRAAEPLLKSVQQRQAQVARAEEEAAEASKVAEAARAVLQAQQAAAREGQLLSSQDIQRIRASVLSPEEAQDEAPEPPPRQERKPVRGLREAASAAKAALGKASPNGAGPSSNGAAQPLLGGAKQQLAKADRKALQPLKTKAQEVVGAVREADPVGNVVSSAAAPAFINPFAGIKLPWSNEEEEEEEVAEEKQPAAQPSPAGAKAAKPARAAAAKPSSNGTGKKDSAAAEAREWIAAWRARQ